MAIYLDNAAKYFDNGWLPFPLPAGKKAPPPKGRTGRPSLNVTITREQILAEAAQVPNGNIAIRMPVGIIGIDVDVYHGGDVTLANLTKELGELPHTYMSTARTDGSGIRLFKVPPGVEFIEGLDGIEIIQPHHRYCVSWPSIHPDLGTEYRWISTKDGTLHRERGESYGDIPAKRDIPELPPAWVERLRVESKAAQQNGKSALTADRLNQLYKQWASKGEQCSHVRRVLEGLDATPGSRHDTVRNAQLTLIRFGETGHPGTREALKDLEAWFEIAIDGDRDISKEWLRGLEGAISMVESNPTPENEKGCTDVAPETEDDFAPFGLDDNDGSEGDGPGEALSTELSDDELGTSRDGRQRVNVRNKSRASAWLRKEIGRGELSGLFYRDGELIFTPRIGESGYIPRERDEESDGPAQVRAMTETSLKTLIEVRYAPGEGRRTPIMTTGDDGEEIQTGTRIEWEPKMFPRECAVNGLEAAKMGLCENLRQLTSVTHTPVMRPDGTVLDTPGYDERTKMLYLPDGADIPRVPSAPTKEEVKEAAELIMQIVDQFPFVEEHHRANWFGMMFTPVLRPMYPAPYPLFMIDAPAPGSGKSYLANIAREVHGGVIRAGLPADEAEMKKSILGILTATTSPIITFDNVRGKIKSVTLESLLTSKKYTDRPLGVTDNTTVPNDRVWTITGNNAEIDGDLARRTYWITIDPKMPRPQDRTNFKLNLKTWVPENRGRIIAALLTVARGWVVAGKPQGKRKRGDDYAEWDAAMEGLLSWAGFPGQFGRVDAKHSEAAEDQEWMLFVRNVADVMGISKPFRMADLVAKISTGDGPVVSTDDNPFENGANVNRLSKKIDPAKLPGDLPDKWSRSPNSKAGFTKSLGRWFSNRSGRYVGDLVVRKYDDRKNGSTYSIERYGAE